MIIILFVVWLLSCCFGLGASVFSLGRHWERKRIQEHRHENGVLHEIVMKAIRTDLLILSAATCITLVLVFAITLENQTTKTIINRSIISFVAALIGATALQIMHDDTRIHDKIRDEYYHDKAVIEPEVPTIVN